jgi:hypothetical protein
MRTPDLARMLAYLDWANDATLAGARDLPHDVLTREVGISFGSILGTLQHMLWAERTWFERWARGADPEGLPGPERTWRAWRRPGASWRRSGAPGLAGLGADAADTVVRYRHARDGDQQGSSATWCSTSSPTPRSTAGRWWG